MATTTTNLGLTLPASNENVSIGIINGNFQLIDNSYVDARGALVPKSFLPDNTDLNDVYLPGTYLLDGTLTYLNTPSSWGTVIVFCPSINATATSTRMQIFANNTNMWYRYYISSSGTWGSWLSIV